MTHTPLAIDHHFDPVPHTLPPHSFPFFFIRFLCSAGFSCIIVPPCIYHTIVIFCAHTLRIHPFHLGCRPLILPSDPAHSLPAVFPFISHSQVLHSLLTLPPNSRFLPISARNEDLYRDLNPYVHKGCGIVIL